MPDPLPILLLRSRTICDSRSATLRSCWMANWIESTLTGVVVPSGGNTSTFSTAWQRARRRIASLW